jgi:hypothetical protein
VVKAGRVLLGATKPSESAPGSIRGDYCIDVGRNICLNLLVLLTNTKVQILTQKALQAGTFATDQTLLTAPTRRLRCGSRRTSYATGLHTLSRGCTSKPSCHCLNLVNETTMKAIK